MPGSGRRIDGVEPRSGATADGMPLSLNRAPAPDLDPWVGRVVVTRVDVPPDFEVSCSVFNDLAYSRIVLKGDWRATTPDGKVCVERGPVLVGPQSRRMDMTCRGSFATVNIGFRPGALACLIDTPLDALVDRVELDDPLGLADGYAPDLGYPADASSEELALMVEDRVRAFIRRKRPRHPDPISRAFEAASFVDPTIRPGEFAARHDISLRQVERIVRRDFGMTPRTALRRARAMDLACHMLGIADRQEEQEFLLRFFDQSHLIREFQCFFGVTPQAFRARPRVLLTLNLEARAARRLEELVRIAPGARRPRHERTEEEEEEQEEEAATRAQKRRNES
ncbi:MAG: AraC family transcriptional regulator [Erythrobacteraceae bacterium HL-111]|nr:MAG: AraC family transcriptional regulator [Erythrobacteraceae bacterium HL-111]